MLLVKDLHELLMKDLYQLLLFRIKNCFQTSMTLGILNHCILLTIWKEMTGKLSLIDVDNEFCFSSDERSHLFGHFCQNDLRS